MKVKGITTIDSEINFGECEIHAVPERIKRLFPGQNLVKITEKGKSYILNTDCIVLIFYKRLKKAKNILFLT
jgi:hypothetical protein|nr:MAG TPA: hypothetical protein [Caudoviricetes sp.]DAS48199.1 MAG TPA: hypothetical protein [Caudoviricetes sp.]